MLRHVRGDQVSARWTRVTVLFAAAVLLATGCSSSSKKSTAASTSSPKTSSSSQTSSANTASDVGVTPTQITLGNVATLTGPIPGLFQGSPNAVEAYFNYINTTQGGVNGRKLVMKGGDDALTCTGNQTATQDLSTQVFAFVGTFTVLDSCGAKVFQAHPEIPDVSY